MDSAPTIPREMMTLLLMASVSVVVSTVMPTRVVAKELEKTTPP